MKLFGLVLGMRTALSLKLFWNSSKLPEILARFQAIEADGVWHLLRVFERSGPNDKLHVFGHIIEEMSHADQFANLAKKNSKLPIYFPQTERRDLYPAKEPLWKTLAFVHVGEVDATNQFREIIKNLPEGELHKSFSRIVGDESGHVELTEHVGISQGASRWQMKYGAFFVRMRRMKESWMRSGQRIGNAISYFLLSSIYWILVPIFAPFAKAFMREAHNPERTDTVKRLAT